MRIYNGNQEKSTFGTGVPFLVLYILKRLAAMIPILFIISLISFVVIQLPPGDYLSTMIMNLRSQNIEIPEEQIEILRERYGYGEPVVLQYLRWIGRFIRGKMGYSFAYNLPVEQLIGERIGLTVLVATSSLVFTWVLALPIGVFSATHKYTLADYSLSVVGFVGMAVPNFFLALLLMFLSYRAFGSSVGGLFSPEMIDAPWSIAKFIDLLSHLWIPVVVLGTGGAATTIRIMRSNMLDELDKPYVTAARSRGLKEKHVIWRYPVKIAMNPFISTVGWLLPGLIAGGEITAIVLNLPTTGPLMLTALRSQDMHLAAGILMLLSVLTVVGTLVSDILLAVVDPRIRFGRGAE